jgi:acetyltransferase-like isoleucine patch superfamily enzyme
LLFWPCFSLNLKIIFYTGTGLESQVPSPGDDTISWIPTKFMGQHLVLRNISILDRVFALRSIEIPLEINSISEFIHQQYPSIDVVVKDDKDISNKSPTYASSSKSLFPCISLIKELKQHESLATEYKIPLNSILTLESGNKLNVDILWYPWDFLEFMQKSLGMEITQSRISPKAKVSKTSVIEGPCVIEEGAVIDDFCKIKGPTYIGKNSFVGMGSLVRNSVLEQGTKIGFNCEIGKSYFAGRGKISHHNVILDTIVGENVWFGGYSGTANVLLDRRNVRYKINGRLVDTGTDHFGSVIGDNCCIGASVIILPGRRILPNSQLQAGTIVG